MIVGLLLALIFIPIRIKLHGKIHYPSQSDVLEVGGEIGLINGGLKFSFSRKNGRNMFEILILGGRIYRRDLDKDKKKEEKKKKPSRDILKILDVLKMQKLFFNLISKLFKATKIRDITLKSKIGMGDPSTLGMFYGMYSCLIGIMGPWLSKDKIYLRPDFTRDTFEGQLSLVLEIAHYTLLIPMFRLFWNLRKISRSKKDGG